MPKIVTIDTVAELSFANKFFEGTIIISQDKHHIACAISDDIVFVIDVVKYKKQIKTMLCKQGLVIIAVNRITLCKGYILMTDYIKQKTTLVNYVNTFKKLKLNTKDIALATLLTYKFKNELDRALTKTCVTTSSYMEYLSIINQILLKVGTTSYSNLVSLMEKDNYIMTYNLNSGMVIDALLSTGFLSVDAKTTNINFI